MDLCQENEDRFSRKRIYVYPNNRFQYVVGENPYMVKLLETLGRHYEVVNKPTSLGILDIFLKIHRVDILYFNWIEDLPHRRFGFLQIPVLCIILFIARLLKIEIVWFVHNHVSHNSGSGLAKKFIVYLMRLNADVMLSHSANIPINAGRARFYSFDHPVENFRPLPTVCSYKYDFLIWGAVHPYKGVYEFVDFVRRSNILSEKKILVAGKFSGDYYNKVMSIRPDKVFVENRRLTEEELERCFLDSEYILFTYNPKSVISSAALSKTLTYGKKIIGPDIGSFGDLGKKGFVHTYRTWEDLEQLVLNTKSGKTRIADERELSAYIQKTSWNRFGEFLYQVM